MQSRSSPIDKPAAVVIGLDSITGLQTARVLAGHGIPVLGVVRNPHHPGCRTNACRALVAAGASEGELVPALHQIARIAGGPCVLFPCTDLSVLTISRCRELLTKEFHVVLPPRGVIERLVDKASFHEYAVANGLPVADSRIVRTRWEAAEAAAQLAFPCVLKPAVKEDQWLSTTSAKLFTVKEPAELVALYERCRTWADTLIVQQWVPGGDECYFTCNAYFDSESRPVLTFVSQKIRQWPLAGGVGCLSRECRNEAVRELTIQLFRNAGHHGFAYLEVKRDERSGRHVIIEPNVSRPTGRSAAADALGVNLLLTHYCDALGQRLPQAGEQPYRNRKWIYLRQDCQAAFVQWRRGQLSASGWVRSLRGCRRDAVFSWRDPMPFLSDLRAGLRKVGDSGAASRRVTPPRVTRVGRTRRGTSTPFRAGTMRTVDYDIHGIVGVRLHDAAPEDVAVISRQIGPPRGCLAGTPDIAIRFVDDLPIDGIQWVEFGRTGFTDEGFFFVNSGKRPARVRLALDQATHGREIVCQRGLRSVPLLMALVNRVAAEQGFVPLHASAFRYGGRGVLVTGWAKGGKTEALLAFTARGADYIGDEWVLLAPDGSAMYGIPERMRLQDWHLSYRPDLRAEVPVRTRLFFKSVRALDRLHGQIASTRWCPQLPKSVMADALPALRRQLNTQVDPLAVFGGPPSRTATAADTVFFMVSRETPRVDVVPIDPGDIAARMAASVHYERLPFMAAALAYAFAFPSDGLPDANAAMAPEIERIARALSGRPAFAVYHPYPCDLRRIYEAMAPACSAGATRRPSRRPDLAFERPSDGMPTHA